MLVINQIFQYILSHCPKNTIVIWLMTSTLSLALGQDFNDYQRLKSSGPIPEDFLLSSSEKYEQSINQISSIDKTDQEAEGQFYQESHYYINQLLLSGKVLFNDPLSDYITKVGKHILKNDPELQKELRFYVVKSSSVNAFATNSGLILVNIGLLAKIENEAQLAFILCHEISHYIHKHPLDIYLKVKELNENNRGFMRKTPVEDILLERSNYSKEKEIEADFYGLELFLKSDYNIEAIETTFNLLKYAHLPFANDTFEVNFFESGSLRFPKNYHLKDFKDPHTSYFPNDFFRTTHPDPDARKDSLIKKLSSFGGVRGKKKWFLNRDQFFQIRKIARFESCYLYLYQRKYESAIYNSYVLLKEFPQSFYLKKIIAQSLYGLTKYACSGQFWDVHRSYEEIEGSIQGLSFLIENLKNEELNTVSIIYNWNLYQEAPDDIELEMMLDDQMQELGRNYISDISFFSDSLPQKMDSLREDFAYIRYAISDLFRDSLFVSRLQKNISMGSREQNFKNYESPFQLYKKRKSKKKLRLNGFNLGLDTVVFVEPFYQRIDDRKKNAMQFLESEANGKNFIHLLTSHSEAVGLEHTMLSTKELDKTDILTFQDLALLNEWIYERIYSENLQMVSINYEEVRRLKEKFGTPYFVWSGIVSLTRPRTGKALVMSAGVIFFPILPYSFYYLFSPNHDTFFYTIVYDIESGENLLLYPKLTKMKDRSDVLNSMVYDLIYQIKTP